MEKTIFKILILIMIGKPSHIFLNSNLKSRGLKFIEFAFEHICRISSCNKFVLKPYCLIENCDKVQGNTFGWLCSWC
jgi:hypothetical protein